MNSSHPKLENASLTGPRGRLDHRLPLFSYFIPSNVILTGDAISWSDVFDPNAEPPPSSPLDAFIRLPDKRPAAVLKIVGEWGPLELRTHVANYLARGRQSATDGELLSFAESAFNTKFQDGLGTEASEPVSVYFGVARYIGRILSNAAEIYSGARSEKDWLVRYPFHCDDCSYGIEAARWYGVEHPINTLLCIAGASFSVTWTRDRWELELFVPGFLGLLSVHLAMAVTRSDVLYTCRGCGFPYMRSAVMEQKNDGRIIMRNPRRPKTGQNNYCGNCGIESARLDAKRRYRERMRQARRLFNDGESLKHIAEELKTNVKNVERWIGVAHGQKTRIR